MASNNEHIGSSLDELLAADGTLAEATEIARKRVEDYKREQAEQLLRGAVHTEPPPLKRAVGGK